VLDKKNLSLLAIALGLGAAGVGLSTLYLKARESDLIEALRPKSPPVAVVVASRDLVKGDKLDGSTLSVREIPSEYVDQNAVTPDQFANIEGEVIIQNLDSGKPLLHSFVGREFPLDFSDTIPEKRRAMTIQIDETNSFSGLLRPGNRVDIFVNVPPDAAAEGGAKGGNEIMPVLENVEVLATGRDSARDYEEKVRLLRVGYAEAMLDQGYTTITLNVTAKEAALLTLAMDKGDLLALLRNRKDIGGSGFTGITRESLKQQARELAAQSSLKARADQLDKAGVFRGEDGLLRTQDGKVLANQDLVLGDDGRLMTKGGIDLSGRGLSLDANGNLVTADGKIVNPDELVVGADGSLMTKDGTILGGSKTQSAGKLMALKDGTVVTENGIALAGAKLNAEGKLVLADGSVVNPEDVIIRADGTVMTRDGKVLEGVKAGKAMGDIKRDKDGNLVTADGTVITGATLSKDGKLVLADGTVVDPQDVIVGADGSLMTKDGKRLEGVTTSKPMGKVYTDKDGNLVTADGTVIKGAKLREDGKLVLADGSVVDPQDVLVNADGSLSTKPSLQVDGVHVREDGKWVLKDGTVVDPNEVSIQPDGSVITKDGKVLEGVSARRVSKTLDGVSADFTQARQAAAGGLGYEIDYIVGGLSSDGVLNVQKLPVQE
jgi:pilus assembly protein CpaB